MRSAFPTAWRRSRGHRLRNRSTDTMSPTDCRSSSSVLWKNPFTAEMRPRYGDDPWGFAVVANRVNMGERYIHSVSVPDVYRVTIKNALMTVVAPDREAVVQAGVVRRGDGNTTDCLCRIVVIA